MRRDYIVCLLLAVITLGLYWPVSSFDFIYLDDPLVLSDCPEVQAGMTWASIKWAFTSVVIANWHPATNLSFLMVSQFFGTAPGPQHLMNALLHTSNAVLLFLVLIRMTGMTWRSATVAAIFACHPLRVESVAWIIERKDVLCAFFFFLTLLCWTLWTKAKGDAATKSSTGSNTRSRAPVYWLALVFFALALLSKPMAVTLPFVLLLLDIWPLKRLAVGAGNWMVWKSILLEKTPFFALTLLFCATTYWIQHDYAAVTTLDMLSLDRRVANATASYLTYLIKLFWPANLAVIYPFPKDYDATRTILKAALLAVITIGFGLQLKRRPWLGVGWCWFLGMGMPIIGIIQVGGQAMADRYTYLPLIGPVVAVVWMAADFFHKKQTGRIVLTGATFTALCLLAYLTSAQVQLWRNTVTLFEHTVAVTKDNPLAQFCLAVGLEHQGKLDEAIIRYRRQMELSPGDYRPHYDIARLLMQKGQPAKAIGEYENAIKIGAHPNDYLAHINFASAMSQVGRINEAVFHLREAIRIKSDSSEALNNLAWTLATTTNTAVRNGQEAVELAQKSCAISSNRKTLYLGTLAAAFAESGKFDDAVATAHKACDLAEKNGETNLLQRNQELLELYRRHQPVRE